VFGRLRRERSFLAASTLSAVLFGAQHLYIIATAGWTVGIASVLLAVLLSPPLAFAFERSGNSIAAPVILHTSSNAPVIVFAIPAREMSAALLPHLCVVLISMYLAFAGLACLPGILSSMRSRWRQVPDLCATASRLDDGGRNASREARKRPGRRSREQ
jgi:ABC-type glycerol-3-phosphate transport system permease component